MRLLILSVILFESVMLAMILPFIDCNPPKGSTEMIWIMLLPIILFVFRPTKNHGIKGKTKQLDGQ